MERARNASYERLPQEETRNEAGGSRSQSPLAARPPIYYEDGPFDPPSSDDDDDEREGFIEKNPPSSPGQAEEGVGFGWADSTGKVRVIVCSSLQSFTSRDNF
jgi:dipeptidyl aminopeptidase